MVNFSTIWVIFDDSQECEFCKNNNKLCMTFDVLCEVINDRAFYVLLRSWIMKLRPLKDDSFPYRFISVPLGVWEALLDQAHRFGSWQGSSKSHCGSESIVWTILPDPNCHDPGILMCSLKKTTLLREERRNFIMDEREHIISTHKKRMA